MSVRNNTPPEIRRSAACEWQPAPQDPAIERLRSAYDAQDRNTRNYVLDCSAVDKEVRQAEAEVAHIRDDIVRRAGGRP
jgi:hypothetical protein